MNFTFIDITEIFRRQNKVLKSETSNWLVFYLIPLALGFSFALLFYEDSKEIMNTLTLFLSIFIPIFINLLATLISFVMNKIVTRHNKERVPLIKETFYNICYLIPVSLLMLILSLFMNLNYGKQVGFEIVNSYINISISYHRLIYTIIGTLFYGGIVHIMLNLLMITKRIFKLFDKEIDLLTNNTVEVKGDDTCEQNTLKPKDMNATDGEE